MIESPLQEVYAAHVRSTFGVAFGDGVVDLDLAELRPGTPPEGYEQFALEFRGPVEPMLPHATYALEHPELGTRDVFMVPVGRDADSVRYEAVFFRLVTGKVG